MISFQPVSHAGVAVKARFQDGAGTGVFTRSAGGPFSPFITIGDTSTVLTGDPQIVPLANSEPAIYAPGTGNTVWGTNESGYGPWANWIEV
jgi:hypothetical protein